MTSAKSWFSPVFTLVESSKWLSVERRLCRERSGIRPNVYGFVSSKCSSKWSTAHNNRGCVLFVHEMALRCKLPASQGSSYSKLLHGFAREHSSDNALAQTMLQLFRHFCQKLAISVEMGQAAWTFSKAPALVLKGNTHLDTSWSSLHERK